MSVADALVREKMYKVRIKKWGLDKNNNMARVAHMVKLRKARAAAGKETSFIINGWPVHWNDVELYLERRPGLQAKMEAGQIEIGNAGAGVVCCASPSPTPAVCSRLSIPKPLDPEHDTQMRDQVLVLFRDYLAGGFDQGLWQYSPEARIYLGSEGQAATMRICAWVSDIWSTVYQASVESNSAAAIAIINAYMDHVRLLIQEQDPTLFIQLLRWYYFLYTWDSRVCRVIARFVGDMCEVCLGPQHPMTLAWRRLLCLDADGLASVLESAARFRLDFIEERARTHGHRASLILLEEHFLLMSMRWQNNEEEIDGIIQWILNHAEDQKFEIGGDYCRMMLRLIAPRIFHGNHNTAEKMLQTVKEWMDGADEDDRYLVIVRAGYQFNRALLLLDQGEEKNALEMFSNAVWVSTRYYCPSRHLIGHIQHWMMSYGVASNPAKGRRWTAVMMQAIDQVVSDWRDNRRKSIVADAAKPGATEPDMAHELVSDSSTLFPSDSLNFLGVWTYLGGTPPAAGSDRKHSESGICVSSVCGQLI